MKRLQGKVAVITGAARGIGRGRAIAVAYAREGAAIMSIGKAAEVSPTTAYPAATLACLAETQRLVETEGSRFIAHQLDTRDLLALRAAAERVTADMVPIVVFLGFDEARHINGASFDVDAGDSGQFTAQFIL